MHLRFIQTYATTRMCYEQGKSYEVAAEGELDVSGVLRAGFAEQVFGPEGEQRTGYTSFSPRHRPHLREGIVGPPSAGVLAELNALPGEIARAKAQHKGK